MRLSVVISILPNVRGEFCRSICLRVFAFATQAPGVGYRHTWQTQGGLTQMIRRIALLIVVSAVVFIAGSDTCQAQQAFGQSWGNARPIHNWDRFYHYPYVYYPQNFWTDQYYRSSNSLYYRYPAEMRIPVYNKKWHNYYPSSRLYHSGHHFILDVF